MPRGKPGTRTLCTVEGCDRDAVARGLCGKHYQRWSKRGDPTIVLLDRERTDAERFWTFVDKTESCWLWRGGKTPEGYGIFSIKNRSYGAHRLAYRWMRGPVPAGLQLDHLCRTPACINPDHLEPVTGQINTLRGETLAAANARKTHCPLGHPYAGTNLAFNKRGARICRTCQRARCSRYYRSRHPL